MLSLRAKVDLGAIAIKGYSTFPKAPALLFRLFCVMSRTLYGGSYPSAEMLSVYYLPQSTATRNFNDAKYISNCCDANYVCNGGARGVTSYRRRKWGLAARVQILDLTDCISTIALRPLRKVWMQLFSLQLWVNSRTELWVLQLWWGNKSIPGKLWTQTSHTQLRLTIDPVS